MAMGCQEFGLVDPDPAAPTPFLFEFHFENTAAEFLPDPRKERLERGNLACPWRPIVVSGWFVRSCP